MKRWRLVEILVLFIATVILLVAWLANSVNAQELAISNINETASKITSYLGDSSASILADNASITNDNATLEDNTFRIIPLSSESLAPGQSHVFGSTYTVAIDAVTGHVIKPPSIQAPTSQ